MNRSYFCSDMHGSVSRYEKLSDYIVKNVPTHVFIGGDILPHIHHNFSIQTEDFVDNYLKGFFSKLKTQLGQEYPTFYIILGNDDARWEEEKLLNLEKDGLIIYAHNKIIKVGDFKIIGYNYVPPTPFQLKDWEKYDVSRYVDHGSISPEEGRRTVPVDIKKVRHSTIQKDLAILSKDIEIEKSIWLMHSPPYKTCLDRADLDGKKIDHAPLDVHVGSIAIRKFIEEKQPLLTLHGHIHESTKLTGCWKEKIGRTYCFNGAHHGSELAIINFDINNLEKAERFIL